MPTTESPNTCGCGHPLCAWCSQPAEPFKYHTFDRCLYQGGRWRTICKICGIEPDKTYGWFGFCRG